MHHGTEQSTVITSPPSPLSSHPFFIFSWSDMVLIWSEAEVNVSGTLDIYVRTASKYDDGHLLHLPNLRWANTGGLQKSENCQLLPVVPFRRSLFKAARN